MSLTDIPPSDTNGQITKTLDTDTTLNTEQKQLDESIDEETMIANAISGDKIKELLSAEGASVSAVLLKADGSVEEIIYDSTPSKNQVSQILRAPPSIIGQYPDLDVIVVGARYEDNNHSFPLNQHKLRYPFNNDTFYGDIFLYRFDQNCVVQDFTLSEYESFAAKSAQDIGKVFKPMINDTQDVYDDEEDEDQYEEDGQIVGDFMREIILNKVKAEFPAKFGREPTEEELESYIVGVMDAAGGLFAIEEDDDVDVDDDEEYDPADDVEDDDIPHEDELDQDKKDIEQDENMSKLPLKDVDETEEKEVVNSEAFAVELREAMECVQHMGKMDREKILAMAREEYKKDMGEEPSDEMLAEALNIFAIGDEDDGQIDDVDVDDDEDDDVDPDVFKKEFTEALDVVRGLGKEHQKELMDKISGTYTELNGVEPTQEQLSDLFGRMMENFADEARDEFIEMNDVADDVENDADYKVEEEDRKQVEDDKKIEVLEELMAQKVAEEDAKEKKVKILVTPVKRRASGSRMGIYLDEQKDTKKTLEVAASKFEQINHRGLTADDSERLEQFLQTGMLFEVNPGKECDEVDDEEYDPQQDTFDYTKDIEDDIAFAQKGDKAFEDDEEDDEDYHPEKDTFDYRQDMEDDNAMAEENEMDENEDVSNMIDID